MRILGTRRSSSNITIKLVIAGIAVTLGACGGPEPGGSSSGSSGGEGTGGAPGTSSSTGSPMSSGGMMPTGGMSSGGMMMPTSCTADADCTGKCPPASLGCKCADGMMGKICKPTCTKDADCPMPPMGTSTCDTAAGVCKVGM